VKNVRKTTGKAGLAGIAEDIPFNLFKRKTRKNNSSDGRRIRPA
jgi:hypothetical protein